jgi:hypothetical protein
LTAAVGRVLCLHHTVRAFYFGISSQDELVYDEERDRVLQRNYPDGESPLLAWISHLCTIGYRKKGSASFSSFHARKRKERKRTMILKGKDGERGSKWKKESGYDRECIHFLEPGFLGMLIYKPVYKEK